MASFASFQNEIQQLQAKNNYSRDANTLGSRVAKIGVGSSIKTAGKDGGSSTVQLIEDFNDGRTIVVRCSLFRPSPCPSGSAIDSSGLICGVPLTARSSVVAGEAAATYARQHIVSGFLTKRGSRA